MSDLRNSLAACSLALALLLSSLDGYNVVHSIATEYETEARGWRRQRDEQVDSRTRLYLLMLLMIPTPVTDGWDNGPGLLAGARVALTDVNARNDFLHGYRLELISAGHEPCGSFVVSTGTVSLVQYAINPSTTTPKPVVAVGGLMCSGPTARVSSIAGKPEVDLLQLSGSNSPIFRENIDSFPYLWRFLVSATVFSDVLLVFMSKRNWTTVAALYSSDSVYYSGIFTGFKDSIANDDNKNITVEIAVLPTEISFRQAIEAIKASQLRVIITFTNADETAELLCLAGEEGMVYPHYQWILTDQNLDMLLNKEACSNNDLLRGSDHALSTYFQLRQEPSSTILVSGKSYDDFLESYEKEVQELELELGSEIVRDAEYAAIVHDEVWALSLALDSAIPVLQQKNISIENYSFNQSFVTDILHNELSKVKFIGASGFISFDDNREVDTVVDILRINRSTSMLVGNYTKADKLQLNISLESLPDDTWNSSVITLPVYVTVLLFTACGIVLVLVTVVLCAFISYWNHPEVKASSPMLSMLMFIGCYMLCFCAFLAIVGLGFSLDEKVRVGFCNLTVVLGMNGIQLLMLTLAVKLTRVHRIFNNRKLAYLNKWFWTDSSLIAVVIVLSLPINIVLAICLVVSPLEYAITTELDFTDGNLTVIRIESCNSRNQQVFYAMFWITLFLLSGCTLFLAIKTRKVHYNDFKDTKKVIAFLAVLISVNVVVITMGAALQDSGTYHAALEISTFIGVSLSSATWCQTFLFIPKIVFPITSPSFTLSTLYDRWF